MTAAATDLALPVNDWVTFKNSRGVATQGTLMEWDQHRMIMEVYNLEAIGQLSEVLTDLTLKKGTQPLYRGKGVVTHLVNTGLLLVVQVVLVEDWSWPTPLQSPQDVLQALHTFLQQYDQQHQLLPDFQQAIVKARHFLEAFQRHAKEINLHLQQIGMGSEPLYDTITATLAAQWQAFYRELSTVCQQIPNDNADVHRQFAQRQLHGLLMAAPIVQRSYTKPLGYAGDYEMINMLLRDQPEGADHYAKVLHKLFTNAPIAQSVRNRNDQMLQYLQSSAQQRGSERFTVLCIACGPAVEIQRFLETSAHADNCLIQLLDFNQPTLKATLANLQATLQRTGRQQVILETVHQSVYALLKQSAPMHSFLVPGGYHVVYSAGLFDYLDDAVCTRLLQLFYTWLQPNGLLFTTNMHPRNQFRGVMDYLLEWHLLYREEQAVARWAPDLGQQRVYCDDTGENIFLEIRKTRSS